MAERLYLRKIIVCPPSLSLPLILYWFIRQHTRNTGGDQRGSNPVTAIAGAPGKSPSPLPTKKSQQVLNLFQDQARLTFWIYWPMARTSHWSTVPLQISMVRSHSSIPLGRLRSRRISPRKICQCTSTSARKVSCCYPRVTRNYVITFRRQFLFESASTM